jgi:Domain of unknown function (DUF6457)
VTIGSVDDWLTNARDTLARAAGVDATHLELPAADATTLLDLARIAAHRSGDRTNAPLLCYLVGRAQGAQGRPGLDQLADAVRRSTS